MPTVTAMEITTDGGPCTVMTVQTWQGRPIGGCTGARILMSDGIPNECVEDSCFQIGFLTWMKTAREPALLKSLTLVLKHTEVPPTQGLAAPMPMTTAGPIPASVERGVQRCLPADRPGEIEHMGCPEGGEDFMGSGDSVFIGLCTALILLPIMAKLFLMGVAEVRPSRFEPKELTCTVPSTTTS